MSDIIELTLPDIGGHSQVDVIDVLVSEGDIVQLDAALITLETDKATMDVPAAASGVVKAVKVSIGSKVSPGDVIVVLEADTVPTGAAVSPNPTSAASNTQHSDTLPIATLTHNGTVDVECDLLVLGAGPGGYSAAFRAADLGLKVVIVERYATLGGVCLNVGCIPSKALLHNAAVIDEVKHLSANGIAFGEPEIDLRALWRYKNTIISKLTTGLAGMANMRKVEVIRGVGCFIDPYHLEVELTAGSGKELSGAKKLIRFKNAIIAAGSRIVKLPFIPDDPRIVDSTRALELTFIPKRMLIIGGGIIGLEMGTVYSTLGARLDVVEMSDCLMPGADEDLLKVWQKMNAHRFDNIMLNTKTVAVEAREDGVWVTFEGDKAPVPQCYDMVLVAAGRSPNGASIGAEKAGVVISERGFIAVDKQMRTNVRHIFAVGDLVGQPMLAHKAVHEGHVAAEVVAGHKAFFDARVIPSVAYTDPEVAWVGVTEAEAKQRGIPIKKSVFPWAASGRAIANGRDEGHTKLLFDAETDRIIGGGIVGTHAGDIIGEICLAIEMGCDADDIGKTIHPHPTLGETVGLSAEVFSGVCTDLPPQRKK